MSSTIILAGDVYPAGRTGELLRRGAVETLFGDLLSPFRAASLFVANLESPLSRYAQPIQKDGPSHRSDPDVAAGLAHAGIRAVNLANNHILDQGVDGLRSTLDAVARAGITSFGAGLTLHESQQPCYLLAGDKTVCLLAAAEHEFSVAGRSRPGACPLNVVNLCRAIRQVRDQCDCLIVLLHAGREHYPYPTPRLQHVCRFLAGEGADAIVCQHSHCLGSYEVHDNCLIVYGQGNFLFESPDPRSMSWHFGVLVELTLLENPRRVVHRFIPFSQSLLAPGVASLGPLDARALLGPFRSRSAQIRDAGFVASRWLRYCESRRLLYASRLYGHGRWLRHINQLVGFSQWLYTRRKRMLVRNVVECETHREVLETLWRESDGVL